MKTKKTSYVNNLQYKSQSPILKDLYPLLFLCSSHSKNEQKRKRKVVVTFKI